MNSDIAKKVLIALDYNPTAQKVAETGFSMAKSMNAGITLFHVISYQAYYSALPSIFIFCYPLCDITLL
jgi:hypothetical protein